MNYYISDLHFSHSKIINLDKRPFSTVEEMNVELIKNWNSVVTKQDNIYVLGDFSWKSGKETKEIIEQLNGVKYLVKGNHDSWVKDGGCKRLFQCIYDYKKIVDGEQTVVMSHYPIMFYEGQHRGSIHLYGHVHDTRESLLYRQAIDNIVENTDIPFNCYNVGCMLPYMNYTPRTLEQIINGGI